MAVLRMMDCPRCGRTVSQGDERCPNGHKVKMEGKNLTGKFTQFVVDGWEHRNRGDDRGFTDKVRTSSPMTISEFTELYKAQRIRGVVKDDFKVRGVR